MPPCTKQQLETRQETQPSTSRYVGVRGQAAVMGDARGCTRAWCKDAMSTHQKTAYDAVFGGFTAIKMFGLSTYNQYNKAFVDVKYIPVDNHEAVEVGGVEPPKLWLTDRTPYHSTPTALASYHDLKCRPNNGDGWGCARARDARPRQRCASASQKALTQGQGFLTQIEISGLRMPLKHLICHHRNPYHEYREERKTTRAADNLNNCLQCHNNFSYLFANTAKYHAQKRNTATFKALCAITQTVNPEGNAAAAPAATNVTTNHALETSRQKEDRSFARVILNFQRIISKYNGLKTNVKN